MVSGKGADAPEVQVWLASLDALHEQDRRELCALLSPEERARRDDFRFEKDRALYEVAHGVVRWALGRALDVPPADVRFAVGRHGKPLLDMGTRAASDLRFNLSHATGLVAVAITRGGDLGVDVEHTARDVSPLELSRLVFSADERAALEKVPTGQRQDVFFQLWTLKEAYIKATGAGMSLDLRSFSFALDGGLSFRPPPGDVCGRWSFFLQRLPSHSLAVCVERPPSGEDPAVTLRDVAAAFRR